jgi:hypothetical protein
MVWDMYAEDTSGRAAAVRLADEQEYIKEGGGFYHAFVMVKVYFIFGQERGPKRHGLPLQTSDTVTLKKLR